MFLVFIHIYTPNYNNEHVPSEIYTLPLMCITNQKSEERQKHDLRMMMWWVMEAYLPISPRSNNIVMYHFSLCFIKTKFFSVVRKKRWSSTEAERTKSTEQTKTLIACSASYYILYKEKWSREMNVCEQTTKVMHSTKSIFL